MTRTNKIIMAVVVIAAIAITSPFAWRAGSLFWAKSRARKVFESYTPNDRLILDQTPAPIAFPPLELDDSRRDSVDLQGYRFDFPKAVLRREKPPSVLLEYERYQVMIRPPFDLAATDALAKRHHFLDTFDEYSAAYHLKLADLDAQPDLESLRRYLLLFAQKGN